MIPVAGSAYTYSYATMGRFVAWIIGWDLVLEYAVGAATVSISWSRYLVKFLEHYNVHLSPQMTMSPWDSLTMADGSVITGIMNLPAVFIVILMSLLLVRGTHESSKVNGVIVGLKVAVVLIFIGLGWNYINVANYTPYIPENTGTFGQFGWSGIARGAASIFFAFIGFDAVSTAAQEARNPQRDMPIGILASLAICTVLYIAVSGLLTGVLHYSQLNVAAPVALAIDATGARWGSLLVKLGAIAGTATVMLMTLMGQSRIFFVMSKDGMLPKWAGAIHPRFRTPWISSIVVGLLIAVFAGLLPISILGDLVNIGTLFAFIIVCIGVWILRNKRPDLPRPFKTPWVPVVPALGVVVSFLLMAMLPWDTWLRLIVWLVIGLVIYFAYSRKRSSLQAKPKPN